MSQVTQATLREHQETHTKGNSWWENDRAGIPLCRVCSDCRTVALSRYAPHVVGGSLADYDEAVEAAGETIEAEDY